MIVPVTVALLASAISIPGVTVLVSASPVQQQIPIHPQDHSQGYEFDPLLHLPGTSPYFDAVGFGLRHDPPPGCHVTAASFLVRHGAIYANEDEYEEYIKPFLWRHEQSRGGWSGSLEFMNKWQSPILEDDLEELTPAGANDARNVGAHLVKRYPHLVNSTRRVLADKKNRCYDTAKNFIADFPDSDAIDVVKLKKPKDGTIDPTLPHKTCNAFTKTPGKKEFAEFLHHYAPLVSARLRPSTPFPLSDDDVLAMQSICGYESAITGHKSPLCAVFSDAEWMSYEYAFDLKYAYMVGPLNPLSLYLGYPWLKAQVEIFNNITRHESVPGAGWPDDQRMFLYFTHREVPPFIATVLGIFNGTFENSPFPTDHVVWTRAWKMADLIPFLGHVGLEKMSCVYGTEEGAGDGEGEDDGGDNGDNNDDVGSTEFTHGKKKKKGILRGDFVRVIANTAPRPIPHCQDGPGASCGYDAFRDIISTHGEKFGAVAEACGNHVKKGKGRKGKKGKGKGMVDNEEDEL